MRNHERLFAAAVVAVLAPRVSADETTRISNAASGDAGSNASLYATISADGDVIAFQSRADNLVAGDSNNMEDVFVFECGTGTMTRVSVASDGTQAILPSFSPVLSADGRYVAFTSAAPNLDTDPNAFTIDVFLHDRATGTTHLVSLDPNALGANGPSYSPSISADGRWIAFESEASNLVTSDANHRSDVFLYDVAARTITRVSTNDSGVEGDSDSLAPVISGDGSVVAFNTLAKNFPNPPVRPAFFAIYCKDLASGALERIDVDSSGVGADSDLTFVSGITDDGMVVAFDTLAALVADDHNALPDVYLRDRAAGTSERVSLASGSREVAAGGFNGKLSGDGRFVAFGSYASDLAGNDLNGTYDGFLRDRRHDVTVRVTIGTLDEEGSAQSFTTPAPGNAMSSDGRRVVFESQAPEFAGGDGNAAYDVFLRQRCMIPPSWSRYGAGFPGRDGTVPSMTPDDDPRRGTTISIGVTNSSRLYVPAFVLVGLSRTSIPTSLGGTLLVDPLLWLPVPLAPVGGSFTVDVPTDWWSCGLLVDLQILEIDPWAAKGVSFSDGLELMLGDG